MSVLGSSWGTQGDQVPEGKENSFLWAPGYSALREISPQITGDLPKSSPDTECFITHVTLHRVNDLSHEDEKSKDIQGFTSYSYISQFYQSPN